MLNVLFFYCTFSSTLEKNSLKDWELSHTNVSMSLCDRKDV